MGIPTVLEGWVRIEDLCWVLDKPKLCEAVTGKSLEKLAGEIALNPAIENRLGLQFQLADYYVAQLSLHSKQCLGRSYNCIANLEEDYPYATLCSMGFNTNLPARVRAVACELCKALYLDRYPQLPNCGRPILPEKLWVFGEAEVVNKFHNSGQHDIVPVIRSSFSLGDEDAFPLFRMPKVCYD
jgi:hypothetical protein